MADRYLRATGNWNGPVWATTSGGVAGSAATPTADDVVYVYGGSYTLDLTTNATCGILVHTHGTLRLNGYKLTIITQYRDSPAGTTRTLDIQDSTMEILTGSNPDPRTASQFSVTTAGLTVLSSNSLLILNPKPDVSPTRFYTMGATFNDVVINLGEGTSGSTELNITGSPTFRSLVIQSKNSAAHTVTFADTATSIDIGKMVLLGASAAARLTLSATSPVFLGFDSRGSIYGKYVAMDNVYLNHLEFDGVTLGYIGPDSTDNTGSWLLQDPPKISTLVDPLTTAPGSNTNWTVSGTVTQVSSGHEGGGYALTTPGGRITTTDTFDLVDSTLVVEAEDTSGYGLQFIPNLGPLVQINMPTIRNRYMKFWVTGNTLISQSSADGITWGDQYSDNIGDSLYFRSIRLSFGKTTSGTVTVYSINPSPTPTNTGAFLPFFV